MSQILAAHGLKGRLNITRARSAYQNACRLRANESVAARIEELRARNAEKCQLSRNEAVQYLAEILKTPIFEETWLLRLAEIDDTITGNELRVGELPFVLEDPVVHAASVRRRNRNS